MKTKPPGKSSAETLDSPTPRLRPRSIIGKTSNSPSVSTARRVLPARSVRQRTVEARSSAAQESTRRGSQPDPCETSTMERKPTDVPTAKSARSRKPVVLPPREFHPRRAKTIKPVVLPPQYPQVSTSSSRLQKRAQTVKTRVLPRQDLPPSSPSTSTSRPGRKAKSTVSKPISAVDPSRSRSHSQSATPQVAQSTKHPFGKLPKCNETSASSRKTKRTALSTGRGTRSRKATAIPPHELPPESTSSSRLLTRAKAVKTRVITRQDLPPSSPSTSTSRPGRKAKSTTAIAIPPHVLPAKSTSPSRLPTRAKTVTTIAIPPQELPPDSTSPSRRQKRAQTVNTIAIPPHVLHAKSTSPSRLPTRAKTVTTIAIPPQELPPDSTSPSRRQKRAQTVASKLISAADPSDKESATRHNLGMEKKKLIAMLSARDDKKRSSIGEARICYCTGSNLEVMTVCEKLDQRGTASLFGEEEDMCICELGRKNRLRRLLFPDDPATSCPNGCEPRALVESEDLFEKSTLTRKIFENGGKLTLLFICRVCCWSSKLFHSEKTIEWAEKKWQNEEGCGAAGIIQCTCGNWCGTPIASIPLDLCDEMANKIKDIDMASATSVTEETWAP